MKPLTKRWLFNSQGLLNYFFDFSDNGKLLQRLFIFQDEKGVFLQKRSNSLPVTGKTVESKHMEHLKLKKMRIYKGLKEELFKFAKKKYSEYYLPWFSYFHFSWS